MKAARRYVAAVRYIPNSKPPVLSLIFPIIIGPKNPPRLPTELMNAIPPAEAVPLRKLVASAQKGALAALPLTACIDCADRVACGDLTMATIQIPIAPTEWPIE